MTHSSKVSCNFFIGALASSLILLSVALQAATITSNAVTGNWNNPGSWVGGNVPLPTDDVVIVSGAIITINGGATMNNLTINSGSFLTDNGNGTITITGNFIVNGTLAGGAAIALLSAGSPTESIDGTGVISNTNTITITGDKNILITSNLIKGTGNVALAINTTVRNYGSITIGGSITNVININSIVWRNEIGSTLNIGGAMLSGNSTVFNASALNNTVNFYSSGNQNVKRPVSGIFHNLTISGASAGIKALVTNNYTINGNLTINSYLSAVTFNITLLGNWINTGGTFSAGTGTVTFSGTSGQTLSSVTGESYNNLTINNASGITADNSIAVANTLTMTAGNIDLGSHKITLGTSAASTASIGTLSRTSGTIIGQFERWLIASATAYLFPVGTASFYRPATITFSNLTPGSLVTQFNSNPVPGNIAPVSPITDSSPNVNIYNTFRDGYWSLTTSNSLASTLFDLSLTGSGFTGFAIKPTTRLLTRASTLANWSLNGTHGTVIGSTVTRTGITQLSGEYCFGDDTNCAAPITSAISALGGTEICNGSTGQVYSVTNTFGSSYTWAIASGGGTIVSGQGTSSITIDWSAIGGVRRISVLESNSCTLGEVKYLDINVHPVKPGLITGKANVPANGAATEAYFVEGEVGYAYTWNVVGNGTIIPTIKPDSIRIQWGNAGSATVSVTATYAGCIGTSEASTFAVDIYNVIYSNRASGNWGTDNHWTCNCTPGASDNVVILNGHTYSISPPSAQIKHLTINAGGILNMANPATVNGDLNLNGTINGNSLLTLSSSVSSPVLDGIGTISTVPVTISSTRAINATASITKTSTTGAFTVAAGVLVNNYGSITLAGGLTGGSVTSTWINHENSTLRVGGALLASGTLNASANGNTVMYTGAVANNVKVPNNSGQYHNISFSGTGASTAPALSSILVKGDFVNNGNFVPSTSTFTFNGTSTISGTATTSFNNLTITGVLTSHSGTVNVARNFVNNGTFNHNNGTISFTGTLALPSTISGAATTEFNHISIPLITNYLTGPPASSILVDGNFTNNGFFSHNNGTVVFNGTSTLGGTSVTSFNHIQLNTTKSLTFPSATLPTVTGNITFASGSTFSHGTGTVELIGGLNQTVDVNGATFNNFTINKLAGFSAIMNSNMTVVGALTLTSGNLNFSGRNLTLNGTFSGAGLPDRYLVSNASSILNVGGSGPTAFGSLYFSPTGNSLNTLAISRSSGTVALGNALNISSNLNLANAEFENPASSAFLTMGSNSSISRTGDGYFMVGSSAPAGGPYNLSYADGNAITSYSTGAELLGNVNNIANNLSGTLTQTAALNLQGLLSFGPTSSYDAGIDLLTVNSSSDITDLSNLSDTNGSIGEIKGGSFSGRVKVERYMSAKGSVNRYVSSPVTGAPLSDLASNFSLVLNQAQHYNEPSFGTNSKGYQGIGLGVVLKAGKGYLIYPTATFASQNITWDVSGPLTVGSNQKTVDLSPTYTVSVPSFIGQEAHDGWNLVGNPYPSNIFWRIGSGWSLTNIDPIISVPDLGKSSIYPNYYWTSNFMDDSGDLPNDVIAMGQSFWVHANAANPVLIVNESAKNSAMNGTFHRKSSNPSEQLIVSINNGKMQDRSFLKLNQIATEYFDKDFDGHKLKNDEMNIYFVDDAQRHLVMHTLGGIPQDLKIELGMWVSQAGDYEISFSNVEGFTGGQDLFLIDLYEKEAIPISTGGYKFNISSSTKANTNRFYLSKNMIIKERTMSDLLYAYPNPTRDFIYMNMAANDQVTTELYDSHGKMLVTSDWKGESTLDISNFTSGMYILRAKSTNGVVVKKIFKHD
jgi:Secretion system C-terminal sorting domain/PKD-like domain